MMAEYSKTTWVEQAPPSIGPTRLNAMEAALERGVNVFRLPVAQNVDYGVVGATSQLILSSFIFSLADQHKVTADSLLVSANVTFAPANVTFKLELRDTVPTVLGSYTTPALSNPAGSTYSDVIHPESVIYTNTSGSTEAIELRVSLQGLATTSAANDVWCFFNMGILPT